MRLINAETYELESFTDHRQTPKYAILSHTWMEEEVLFQDLQSSIPACRDMKGFKKIEYTCQQALKDGLEYAWVDTCCIDKSSSAELSEAINSMFAWYKESEVCYVYLADVDGPAELLSSRQQSDGGNSSSDTQDDPRWSDTHEPGSIEQQEDASHAPADCNVSSETSFETQFAASRWFTRGWTLQELIAPSRTIFFSRTWGESGSLKDLAPAVSSITNIPLVLLYGETRVTSYSAARRMSWASRRKTTRIEDEAYCLLGIFGVNMPLLYGEREGAFRRLQQEILQSSNDLSLFAWDQTRADGSDWHPGSHSAFGAPSEQTQSEGRLLAKSPAFFASSGYIRLSMRNAMPLISLTATGIQASMMVSSPPLGTTQRCLLALNCHDERFPDYTLTLRASLEPDLSDEILHNGFDRGRRISTLCRPCTSHRLYLIARYANLASRKMTLLYDEYGDSSHEWPTKDGARNHHLRILEPSSKRHHRITVTDVFPENRWVAHGSFFEPLENSHLPRCGFNVSIEPALSKSSQNSKLCWEAEVGLCDHEDVRNEEVCLTVRCRNVGQGHAQWHVYDPFAARASCPACSSQGRPGSSCKYFQSSTKQWWSLEPTFLIFTGLPRGECLRFRSDTLYAEDANAVLTVEIVKQPSRATTKVLRVCGRRGPALTVPSILAIALALGIGKIRQRMFPTFPALKPGAGGGMFLTAVELWTPATIVPDFATISSTAHRKIMSKDDHRDLRRFPAFLRRTAREGVVSD